MTDQTKRAEAMQKAAAFRERAARYDALAVEARQRGDMQMSIEFDRKAVEELVEASRIEESINKFGKYD